MSSQRFARVTILITVLSLLMTACGGEAATNTPVAAPTNTAGAAATTAPSGSGATGSGKQFSGELSVYLNQYYDPNTDKATADLAAAIAKEYEAAHPGVKITLVANLPTGTDLEAWLAGRMAANQSPDIMWQQFGTRNQRGSTWWVPLNPYFDAPNPYIAAGTPGHDKWSDSLPDYVVAQTRASDGNWYQVSLDWVETGLYYNKDLFSKAGVDPNGWKSWNQMVSEMKTVKEKTNTAPLGMFVAQQGWSNWWWMDDMLLTANWADKANDFYLDKYNIPGIKFRQMSAEEMSKAILEGKLNATDPRMDNYLKMVKDYISLLPCDYAGIPILDELAALTGAD